MPAWTGDVLLAVATRAQAGPAGAGLTRLLAVDGGTGLLVTLTQLVTAGDPSTARALGADLDRDGYLDIAVREAQTGGGLAVVSAAGGRVLWVQPLVRSESFYSVLALPDVTGDGTPDVAFVDDPVFLDDDLVNEEVSVLSGADGAVLQSFERDIVLVEDRDGDGRAELLLADVSGEDLVLTVVDGTGKVLRTARWGTAVRPTRSATSTATASPTSRWGRCLTRSRPLPTRSTAARSARGRSRSPGSPSTAPWTATVRTSSPWTTPPGF